MTWTPPADQAGEQPDESDEEADVTVRRVRKERAGRKRRRGYRGALLGHMSSMGGMIVLAVVATLGVAAFVNLGPFAEPGPLSDADRATLAAKYEQIAAVTNQTESGLNAQLGQFAAGITDVATAKSLYGQYYDAEKKFLDDLSAVDWKGARKQANALMDAVRAELDVLAQARDATTQQQIDDATTAWGPKYQAVNAATTPLRQVLGIPLPAPTQPATEAPLPTCTPSASPGASGSLAPSASGSTGPSGSPAESGSPSASGSALPSESPAATCLPIEAPSGSLSGSLNPSPSASAGESASASGSAAISPSTR